MCLPHFPVSHHRVQFRETWTLQIQIHRMLKEILLQIFITHFSVFTLNSKYRPQSTEPQTDGISVSTTADGSQPNVRKLCDTPPPAPQAHTHNLAYYDNIICQVWPSSPHVYARLSFFPFSICFSVIFLHTCSSSPHYTLSYTPPLFSASLSSEYHFVCPFIFLSKQPTEACTHRFAALKFHTGILYL